MSPQQDLSGLRPGDEVIVADHFRLQSMTRCKVTRVGRIWIHASDGYRYPITTGHGQFSRQLFTEQGYADELERQRLLAPT